MATPRNWEIPLEIKARLSDQSGRQRAMEADGHLVLVLHKVPHAGELQREGVFFWRNPAGEWHYSERGQGLPALNELVQNYNDAIVTLERTYEKADGADAWFHILEQVGPLCRASRNLYETLQAGRQAIGDLQQRSELQGPCDLASEAFRAAELLQTDARNALEFRIAKQGEIQAKLSNDMVRASHRLNILAAIFLPLAVLASVFGMNLPSGFDHAPAAVFWSVLVLGIAMGVILSVLLLNHKGDDTSHKRRRPGGG